jgi:hypothetical protein
MSIILNGTGTGAFTDASGNVGIGTATPATKCEIYSTANSYTATRVTANSGSAYIELYANPVAALTGLASSSTNPMTFNVNGVERGRFAANGDFSFNSGYGTPAVAYGCRAWVNFDGTATPPTIRASGNVASVVRNSTGNYTITFTNAMPDANYVMNGNSIQVGSGNGPIVAIATGTTPLAGSINIVCTNDAGSVQNSSIIHVTIHR